MEQRRVDRETLQFLAEQPIGSLALQAECDRIAHLRSGAKPSEELKEAAKRATKIWLPEGKKSPVRGACNEPNATQCDIEDAVEAAGGKRGQ